MGVSAHLNVTPVGAIICGFVVGAISVCGYRYLTPILSNKLGVQDICGVHNLHGMPGLCSCIVGILATLGATHDQSFYGAAYKTYIPKGDNQPLIQLACMFITLGIAIVGGAFTGVVMKNGWRFSGVIKEDFFNDRTFWNLPSDYDFVVDREETLTQSDKFIEMKSMKKQEERIEKVIKKSEPEKKKIEETEKKRGRSRSTSPSRSSRSRSASSSESRDKRRDRKRDKRRRSRTPSESRSEISSDESRRKSKSESERD